MQVYRGMDIGTAKPSRDEQARVAHHLIDLAEPTERFTVTRFAEAAAATFAAIEARQHTALLVGGTGLYLQAVIGDLQPPGEFPEVRATLADIDPGLLHARLASLDPVAASRIEPGNLRRVQRALEVTLGTGRPFSSFGPGVGAYPPLTRFALVGVWLPRRVLGERIEQRVGQMVDVGLIEEVTALAPVLGPTARQALGYKEVLAHLERGEDLEACVAETVRRTRELGRRQRAWFRRDPRIRWHGTRVDPAQLLTGLGQELDRVRGG
jgi:tRNA dimethylallyltransferase